MPKSTSPTAREREVCRYYQRFDLPAASAHDRNDRETSPRSSSDPVLTAFAQLGAHRLCAKRGLITLSARDTEYILAEAGVGLGLQQDDDKNDPLWHGAVALKENCGLGMELVKIFCGDDEATPKYAFFPDLSKDDRFAKKCVVEREPHVRFLACVPLRSQLHRGMVIGTYIVVDDKPHEGLSEGEIEFLIDMGVTVMDHLEAQRLNQMQYRSERMVKAIGLFIEGKSTLRDWWLAGGHKSQHSKIKKRIRHGATLDGQADLEFGVQDPLEDLPAPGRSMASVFTHTHTHSPTQNLEHSPLSRSPSSSTLSHIDRSGDGRPGIPQRDSYTSTDTTTPTTTFSKSNVPRNSSVTTFDTSEGTAGDGARPTTVAFDLPQDSSTTEISKELQEALLTKDLKAVFGRASNLIREAGGVDGTIFYDASISSFGAASQKDSMEQKAPGNFDVNEVMHTSEDDAARRSSDTDTQAAENCCSILGFSTRKRSSLRGHAPPPENQHFPEKVLRTLLKRYPHGKVFNFDEDGSFSSSDTDNAYLPGEDPPVHRREISDGNTQRKRISREAEAAALRKALPGARSVFWFPLWDQSRERWYAGSLVWSTSPTRLLCPIEDLTYLAAFGNSVMAEVARLSALVLTQMKNDFISSISHELRSPLHGVLASVEFLQETEMTEVQTDMVNNINASGRVLLDTINHVLDFSKVNKRVKDRSKASKKRAGKKPRMSVQEEEGLDNTEKATSDVCVLSEEVVGSVYAGRNLSKLAYDTCGNHQSPKAQSSDITENPVTIIMDVQWRPNWTFEVDAGAWRRILLNLFGNSMKYTRSGYIKVSLTVEDDVVLKGKKGRSMMVLKVKDSGKGISKEFLKHHLYKPFAQEDSLAAGAGLGLSIVRHIIQDLEGEINFKSEQGVGTEAIVKLPMVASLPSKQDVPDFVAQVKLATQGRKFCLDGFDRYPDIPDGILPADFEGAMFLKSSMHMMLQEWFGMEPGMTFTIDKTQFDVEVIMESGVSSLDDKLKSYESRSDNYGPSIVIILCEAYPQGLKAVSHGLLKVFYVPQPFGPHKIAKVLHQAFVSQTALPEAISKRNENTSAPEATPAPVQPSYANLIPDALPTHQDWYNSSSAGYTSPTSDIPMPNAPAPVITSIGFDRRTSIDTSVVNHKGGLRVLLVEDNEINLKLLVAYMRKLKLNHDTAINGLEALNRYKEAQGGFDVIFMDISMPIMSGIESTRHIRRFEREQGLNPVALVALTGAANPTTRQEAFSSGVDLFLTKPVPMRSLKIMLDDLRSDGRRIGA